LGISVEAEVETAEYPLTANDEIFWSRCEAWLLGKRHNSATLLGTRKRERPKITWLNIIRDWMKMNLSKLLRVTDNNQIKSYQINIKWFIRYSSTDAGSQQYRGNVFTTNNITSSVS